MDDELLTFDELAARLKVGAQVVERLWRKGDLPGYKLTNKTVRFLWSEVVVAMQKNRELRMEMLGGGPPLGG